MNFDGKKPEGRKVEDDEISEVFCSPLVNFLRLFEQLFSVLKSLILGLVDFVEIHR